MFISIRKVCKPKLFPSFLSVAGFEQFSSLFSAPLHVLYSYEGSSSDDDVEQLPTQALLNNVPATIIPSRIVKHQLRKMPPVHKIEAKK